MGRSNAEDRDLVGKVLIGNRKAFEQLVQKYQRLVNHVVYRMVGNDADREDICQEVFLRVFEHLAHFRFESKMSTWIARIAYNTSLKHLEKKRVPLFEDMGDDDITIDDCAADLPSPAEWADARSLSVRLAEEIDRLPVLYGTILALYHLHEMKYDEIAEVMQLPDGTVKSYLFRGRKMLKDRLTAGRLSALGLDEFVSIRSAGGQTAGGNL